MVILRRTRRPDQHCGDDRRCDEEYGGPAWSPTANPCTRAAGPATPAAAVAATATLFRAAVPIDPPTCMKVFAVAAATPANRMSIPLVATPMAGVKTQPIPTPSRISAGMIRVT